MLRASAGASPETKEWSGVRCETFRAISCAQQVRVSTEAVFIGRQFAREGGAKAISHGKGGGGGGESGGGGGRGVPTNRQGRLFSV